MRRLLVAAALGAAVLASSAAAGEEGCTLPNAGDWRRWRSSHFDLLTDASELKASLLTARLERTHALVVKALVGDDVEIPGRVRVIAFASERDFRRTTRAERAGAYFTAGGRVSTPTVVLYLEGYEANAQTVAHELAHHVSWYLFPRQPSWFSEGLATFVQSVMDPEPENAPALGTHLVRGGREGGAGAVGVASPVLARWLKDAPAVAPEELLAWNGHEHDDTGRHHVWSWLLYHWLWNTRPKAFGDFTARLSAAEEPAAAWRAAFHDLDPARPEAAKRLADELDRYRRAGRYVYYRVEAAADGRAERASLSTAEVHVALLETRFGGSDAAEQRRILGEALREAPGEPDALARLAELDGTSAVAALRARTAAAPRDGRAWLALGRALDRASAAAEKETALRQAAALLPDDAVAQNETAWALLSGGRAREALAFANRAADLAPWEPSVVDTLAVVAGKLGQCPQALQLHRRALALFRAEAQRSSYEDRMRKLERECAAPALPSAAPAPATGKP
jgi:Flp pilus assembly protein TadD